jgi:TonB-dependent starch-binding outer membrane protein SusC
MSIFSLQLPAGKRRLTIVLCFFLLFVCNLAFSQSRKVTGTVTDNNNQPVVGATVTVKGTGRSTSTDGSGNYSSIGYEEQEINTSGRNNINTSLSIRVNENDEVVVVGYGTQRKKDLTGSVGIVDVADAKKTATYDVAKMLQGQVAGVTVQGSGEPGAFVQI